MWGGRRPEDVGEQRTIHAVSQEPQSPGAESLAWRAALSLSLVAVGMILLSVGMGLILGVGGALAGAGLVAIAVGLILGLSGDET